MRALTAHRQAAAVAQALVAADLDLAADVLLNVPLQVALDGVVLEVIDGLRLVLDVVLAAAGRRGGLAGRR